MKIALTDNQKQAIESIDKSMLVVAGAGSGKTLVLVRRFVEILQKQPELSVHNLLAVTYTRKAAKEMRTRIKVRLKELYEQAKIDELECKQRSEISRWHQCLADMDSAYIDTIHSLCQSILRSFTVEIGLDPQIEIMEEIEKAQIIQESIDETFRQLIASDNYDSDSSDKAFLAYLPLENIESFLQMVLKNHLRFNQIANNFQNLSTNELIANIENLLTRTQKSLLIDLTLDEDWLLAGNYAISTPFAEAGNKLEDARREAVRYFANMQEIVRSFSDKQDFALGALETSKIKEAWKILLDIAKTGALRVGGNTDAAKEMRATIKMLIEKCKDYSQSNKKGYGLPLSFAEETNGNSEQYWQLWRSLLKLARQAQNIYAAKKLEIGKVDFDDLISKTKSVLQMPNSAVREYYNKTFAHILVDEFQDTNAIQAEIITLLAGAKTKLFLIGDDKQSIYKFQGADVSTFNAWQRKEIDSLVFEHSFRSDKSIVDFVNNIFSNLLPANKAHVDYRAKYSALEALREPGGDLLKSGQKSGQPQVEIIQLPDGITSDDEQNNEIGNGAPNQLSNANIEGKAVANWILDKVKNKTLITTKDGKTREINFGDFAVLTGRNSDLQIFESCLSELNIPYVTSGGRTFLERQEIYDLENMLLFLSNPSDSHALLAVLRSLMFGISDEIIHSLASTKSISLWQAMQDRSSGYQPLAEGLIVLKRLMADLPVLSLSELVYRIIRDTNYDLVTLTLPDGKQRYKNIWKFYMLAKDDLSAADLVERMNLSRQLAVSETNAAIDNNQSVKLMTIHAAKGLEFPAVALPCLSNPFNQNKSKLLFHDQYGIVLNTSRTEEERDEGVPLPYQLGRTLDDDMDLAEKKRLLYVAMTRARDHLALFVNANGNNRKSAASWLQPILAKLNEANFRMLSPELNDLMAEQVEHGKQTEKIERVGQINQVGPIEQLLEPIAIDLDAQASTLPEVTLSQRITPSLTNAEPNSILIGKFFHRIMEYLPQDKVELQENELIALLEQFSDQAVHPVFKAALIEEGKKLLSIYANSELQCIFVSAKTICHEWSYYMMNLGTEQLLLNRPDLLLESKEGVWYLIDYKTDRFPAEDIKQQALRHRQQLERYAQDFSQLTKIEAKRAIYFAQFGKLYEV